MLTYYDKNDKIVYESGAQNAAYTYGVGLISMTQGQDECYYNKNGHGDVVQMTDATGAVTDSYTYDAFGNQLTSTNADNPFRYCGEYFDTETDFIYLRNRYYNPQIGRFITEDPAKDGLNWYVYCGNNPVMFVDPLGLEQIVISGGEYRKGEKYKYNFIEPAIKKLKEMKENSNGELVTWLIANEGWSENDLEDFESVASKIGVRLAYFSNTDNLIKYINSKYDAEDRSADKITKFAIFAHGWAGTIALGYNYTASYNTKLDFKDSMIDRIDSNAFDNPNSAFYSCNTGKDLNGTWGNNFAQKWVNKVGGKTWAWNTFTFYDIFKDGTFWQKRYVQFNWFIKEGATNYPVGSGGVDPIMFTR